MRIGLFWVLYLIAGLVIAGDRDYLKGINNVEEVVEAALAVLLWPLLLLGVDMRI